MYVEQFVGLGFIWNFQVYVVVECWDFDFIVQCCYGEVDWNFVVQVIVFMFKDSVLFYLNLNVQIVCWCVMFVGFVFVCQMDLVIGIYVCWNFN